MAFNINNIIKLYKSSIFKTCLGYTNNVEDANDLTQEVLIRIWKGIKNFREDSSLKTWIYRITVNTCLMFHRRKKIKLFSFNEIEEPIHNDIQNHNEKEEDLKLLNTMILKLKEKDRLIIILYLEDLSYEEISDVIGISVNYVGVKINRIKKELTNQIKKR